MKTFLSILLYLICSECRIDDGPVEEISYSIVESGRTDNANRGPIIIRNLNDYTNFYISVYGTYPGYTDIDFNNQMLVVLYKNLSSGSHGFTIDSVTEGASQLLINTTIHKSEFSTCDMSPRYTIIALKSSDKEIVVN